MVAQASLEDPTAIIRGVAEAARDSARPRFITRAQIIDLAGIDAPTFGRLRRAGVIRPVGRAREGRTGTFLYSEETILIVQDYMLRANDRVPDARRTKDPAEKPAKRVDRSDFSDEEAVAVFRLLDESRSLKDIVIEARLHPDTVQAIADRYRLLTGAFIVDEKTAERINALPVGCKVEDAATLYNVVRLALRSRACARCRQAERCDQCLACVVGEIERAISAKTTREVLPEQEPQAREREGEDDPGGRVPVPEDARAEAGDGHGEDQEPEES